MGIKSRKVEILSSPTIMGKTLIVQSNDNKYGLFLDGILIATCERQYSLENYAIGLGANKIIYPPNPSFHFRENDDD